MDSSFVLLTVEGVFAVLWWLLRQKDAAQQKSIEILFKKHDDDARELQELKLQIAEGHYKKGELDAKFDRLESAFRDGLRDLGDKFDHLAGVLVDRRKP